MNLFQVLFLPCFQREISFAHFYGQTRRSKGLCSHLSGTCEFHSPKLQGLGLCSLCCQGCREAAWPASTLGFFVRCCGQKFCKYNFRVTFPTSQNNFSQIYWNIQVSLRSTQILNIWCEFSFVMVFSGGGQENHNNEIFRCQLLDMLDGQRYRNLLK